MNIKKTFVIESCAPQIYTYNQINCTWIAHDN